MNELEKIRRVASREVPGAPQEVLLVLDATVGQNGVAQAREFTSVAGVNGIVLTKLDGTAKGGVAVAIAHDLKLPIRYVGVGEGIDDLVPFSRRRVRRRPVRGEVVSVDGRRELTMDARAVSCAARGRGRTSPNPLVGAVVVSPDGVVVGQGFHERAGEPHAEVHALDDGGRRAPAARRSTARSSRAAITGRTGPCVEPDRRGRASRASSPRSRIRIRSCSGRGFAYPARRTASTSRSGCRRDDARSR